MTPAAPDDRAFGPPDADDWVALVDEPLPVDAASAWAVRPDCGAVVSFSGTVRDHSGDRNGVTGLEYEAYDEQALPRMEAIVAAARRRGPSSAAWRCSTGSGPVPLGESAVVVVASAPHRDEAFEAARFGIDTLKATVPDLEARELGPGRELGHRRATGGRARRVGCTRRRRSRP